MSTHRKPAAVPIRRAAPTVSPLPSLYAAPHPPSSPPPSQDG